MNARGLVAFFVGCGRRRSHTFVQTGPAGGQAQACPTVRTGSGSACFSYASACTLDYFTASRICLEARTRASASMSRAAPVPLAGRARRKQVLQHPPEALRPSLLVVGVPGCFFVVQVLALAPSPGGERVAHQARIGHHLRRIVSLRGSGVEPDARPRQAAGLDQRQNRMLDPTRPKATSAPVCRTRADSAGRLTSDTSAPRDDPPTPVSAGRLRVAVLMVDERLHFARQHLRVAFGLPALAQAPGRAWGCIPKCGARRCCRGPR